MLHFYMQCEFSGMVGEIVLQRTCPHPGLLLWESHDLVTSQGSTVATTNHRPRLVSMIDRQERLSLLI